SRWRREFVRTARSLIGAPGWVSLSYSPHDGRLYNQIALDYSHALGSAVPILMLDLYDHAYQLGLRANDAPYIDAFLRRLAWTAVAERLLEATGNAPRGGAEPAGETLPSISVEELRAVLRSDQRLQMVDARPRNYISRNPDTMPAAVWRDPERVDDWCGELS